MLRRLLRLLRTRSLERDMDDEMRFHVDMEAADLVARGVAPDEARRLAYVRFGGVAQHKESGLEARRGRWAADAVHDLHYAARTFRRNPGFAIVTILTAALGIGATTAVFSVVDGVLLKPLPFPDAHQLVAVWSANPELGTEPFTTSPPDFYELASANVSELRSLSAFYPASFTLAVGDDEPVRITGARVSPTFFATLGVVPQHGRAFLPHEGSYGAHRIAIISERLRERAFGSDAAVVGRVVTIDREPYTIVGVVSHDVRYPERRSDMWVPLAFEPGSSLNTRGNYFLQIVGRLSPGTTLSRAESALRPVAARVAAEHPEGQLKTVRLVPLQDQVVGGGVRSALFLLFGAIGLVLLIACVNVAGLLLARGAARMRELAVRAGLGAGRGRLVRQLLTESLVLGVLGGAIGVLLALASVALVTRAGPSDLPRLDEVVVDGRTLGFAILLSLVTAVAFGLAPALQASRAGFTDAIRQSGRTVAGSRRRARELLVAVQMALAVILLVGAGLLIRSYAQVARTNPGFRVENLLTMSLALPENQYPAISHQRVFVDRLLEQVRGLPGVRSAAVSSALSLGGGYWGKLISFGDRAVASNLDQVPAVGYRVVTQDYFETMSVALRTGRRFDASDVGSGQGVAIVNESAARKFWPTGTPIGTTIWLGPPETLIARRLRPGFRFPRLRIIGVVADERFTGLDQPSNPEVYQLAQQVTERPSVVYLVVRSEGDPLALAAAVRREVRALDPYQPVADVATMSALVRGALAQRRFMMTLLGSFAALALTLAAIGLYGVVSYAVMQRRRELGIRIALGATARRVVALVVGQGLRPALAGAAVGLLLALMLTRLMRTMLFGVAPNDPVTVLGVGLTLAFVAAMACLVPGWRVLRVHPAEALRSDA